MHIADRILHSLALPFHLNGHTVVTTASIGIVLSGRRYAQPDDLVRDADSAMYHAKAQGKGQYAVFAPAMHAQVLRFLHLEAALREAIARQELRLHYQPIIALPSRAIIGVEALARWQHPERGAIAPAEFIPLAEETGLIIPLGDWVLRTACAQAKAWQDAGWASCSMAVNVSAQQLQRPEAGSRILQIVHETGLEPQCLKLELTESSVWEHGAVIAALLQQLNTAGVQLSVDDFGTGYSSLSALKHLPITSLKIDQAFVHDIPTDANDAAIVMAMIAVAHSLDLQVVAEGVETEAQVAFLRAQQCDAIQGYLISRPACAETLTQRWQARHWGACDRVDAPTS
jgi:EAL domain-containing protein (putative c-di-GMP-specific phosphodiesterase class I)